MSKYDSKPRFCEVKRLTEVETKNLRKLDPSEIDESVGFILTPKEDGWEKVTYYGEKIPTNAS
jgi:hypothetical protein